MHLHRKPSMISRRTGALIAVMTGLLAASSAALADAPLIDDPRLEIESRNKQFVASPGPGGKSTLVYRRVLGAKGDLLWQMPRWFENASLSDDGTCLVDAYYGSNLIPRNYDRDQVMMTFFWRGKQVGIARLRDLIRDFGHLAPGVSHYAWGYFRGFVGLNRFAVDTVEGRRLEFDTTTGTLAVDEPSPKANVQTSDDTLPAQPPPKRPPPSRPSARPR